MSNFNKTMSGLMESAELARRGDTVASMDAMLKARLSGLAAGVAMDQLTKLFNSEAEEAQRLTARGYVAMRGWVIGSLIVGGLACALAAWWQMRLFSRSLSGIQELYMTRAVRLT